ncbi:MAG: hypothetical protein F9K51_00200 [Candidatus Dadabacteria bacterium]|nr:MAG: hypothetical protein F9K51_00200 [Candidatus Dadabacteria bacterium]
MLLSILKDISSGKESNNYRILKKAAGNNETVEQFIIERAKSILVKTALREPPHNHYEILAELKILCLSLLTLYYPDKKAEQWIGTKNKIDGTFEALKDSLERNENGEKLTPIVVNDHRWWENPAFNSPVSFFLGVLIIIIATQFIPSKKSSVIFGRVDDKTAFSEVAEADIQQSLENLAVEDFNGVHLSEPGSGGEGGASSSGKENNDSTLRQEKKTTESKNTYEDIGKNTQENDPENENTKTEKAAQQPERTQTMPIAQTKQERGEAAPDKQKAEEERPPVRVEELLTAPGQWIFDFNILYSNIDTSSDRAQVITIDGPLGQPILIPVFLGEQVTDEDFLSYIMNLRYGLTRNLEIFTYLGFFSDFQRSSLNGESESDSDFNFNFTGIGATYQIRPEDKYPAILASASANIADNTNFGNDDYEVNYFKTFTGTLVSYYTADPIVFFVQAIYQQNLKRKNEISINPGEFFSLSPQIFFVVNPFINLTWGLRWRIQGHDEINGDAVNSTRTGISPIFGVTYGVTNNLILSLDTEYRNEGSISQAIANLGFTYMF